MSELTKKVNRFFDEATKAEVENLINQMSISEHLKLVLKLKYIEEKDINFIAYQTGYSKAKINSDLAKLRKKMSKVI